MTNRMSSISHAKMILDLGRVRQCEFPVLERHLTDHPHPVGGIASARTDHTIICGGSSAINDRGTRL